MYKTHDLLWPGDDPNFPNGFFSKAWAGRGREYRMLVEPLDIANWCASPGCCLSPLPSCCQACCLWHPPDVHQQGVPPSDSSNADRAELSMRVGAQVLQEQAGGVRSLCGL